jgi:hypothetical protein
VVVAVGKAGCRAKQKRKIYRLPPQSVGKGFADKKIRKK